VDGTWNVATTLTFADRVDVRIVKKNAIRSVASSSKARFCGGDDKQMATTSPTKPGIWWLGSESAKKEQQ